MSNIIETHLNDLGYARLLIVPRHETLAASDTPDQSIANVFLPNAPGLGLTTSEDEGYHFFPQLNVYLGYVKKEGYKQALELDANIYGAEYISLIRPVDIRLASSADNYTWGLYRLGIDRLHERGLDGNGIRVGHLDTGIDAHHEALRGKLKGFIETTYDGNILQDNREPEFKARDSGEHGTHTAGTICGGLANGMAIGVAPRCELYSGLVIEGGDVLKRVLKGMEWCLSNNIRILSLSLGLRGYTPYWTDITSNIRRRGILPIFAIGNEGIGTSRSPANYPEALSVGATDSNDHVAPFSSSIKFERPLEPYQPDCVAPGNNIVSAKVGGGVQAMDGSSMATPHVAGIAAILMQAHPDATINQIEKAILETCQPLPNEPQIRYGNGIVNPLSALDYLNNG